MSDLGRTEDDDGMTPAERRGFGARPKGGFSPSHDGIAGFYTGWSNRAGLYAVAAMPGSINGE